MQGAALEDASIAAVSLGDKHRHASPAGSQLGERRSLPRTCICKLWCVVVLPRQSQPSATVWAGSRGRWALRRFPGTRRGWCHLWSGAASAES